MRRKLLTGVGDGAIRVRAGDSRSYTLVGYDGIGHVVTLNLSQSEAEKIASAIPVPSARQWENFVDSVG